MSYEQVFVVTLNDSSDLLALSKTLLPTHIRQASRLVQIPLVSAHVFDSSSQTNYLVLESYYPPNAILIIMRRWEEEEED